MKHRHTLTSPNVDVCSKCGMTGLMQAIRPERACRPRMSKRRAKKIKAWYAAVLAPGRFKVLPGFKTHENEIGNIL